MRPRLPSRPRSRPRSAAQLTSRGGGRLEAQAATAVGGDQRRAARVVAELAAQPAEVHVDGLGVGVERRLPHVGHQLAAGDDVARARHQGVQELELLAGEPDLAVATPHLSRGGVESYVLHSQHAVKRRDRPVPRWSLWVNCGELFWSTISRLRRATCVSRAAMLTGGPKMSPRRWTTGPLARPRRTSGIFGSRPMTLMIPSATPTASSAVLVTKSTESPRLLMIRPP